MRVRTTARWLAAAVALMAAMTVSAGPASADPPPGWQPGTEFDYGRIQFTQHGWFTGRPGNYHTGDIEIEEDDDGVTGFLADWFCRGGAVPPTPYSSDPVDPGCKLKSRVGLELLEGPLADFDQRRDRLDVHLDVPTIGPNFEPLGTVRIDLTISGHDAEPYVHSVETPTSLEYEEYYYDVTAKGTVDGKRLNARNTVIHSGSTGFWLYQWVRTP